MVFPSTPGVSVRVLRTIFVPGCGGPHEFVNSVSFSRFLSAVIPFSVSHLLSRSLIRSLASSFPGTLPTFPNFLFVPLSSLFHSPFPLPPYVLLFWSLSPCSPSSCSLFPPPPLALLLASKVPWEPCGSSAGRHTNTTAATTGTSLSFSLFSLFLARFFFFPLPSPLSLFSSSLFNVEVLSNCWLLLWLGGNGIFRRMPHAVALTIP